ncbi:Alpha/Beta hydrolase protein [Xylaria palmicola]|nr:Alpha/Beta hydrolase protein [Xylaria palmicola]
MAFDSYHQRLATAESLSQCPRDPELEKLLSSNGPWPDPPFTDVPQCRGISDCADSLLVKALGQPPAGVQEKTCHIPTNDPSFTSAALLTLPAPGSSPGPLIVLFHPGGFFLGSPAKLAMYARPLAQLFNASVLCPSYRFAPEHPFPTGVEDAWATLQWAASHASSDLGADPASKGFLVGGISSGANFAVALARRAAETGLRPPVTGAWAPIFMGLNSREAVPEEYRGLLGSHEQHRDALVIDEGKAKTMWEYYRPDVASPLFNPLATPLDGGRGLPRVFLQVVGHDLFRDDGLVLAYALQDRGVEVKLEIYPGVCHSFWVFAPEMTVSRKFVHDIAKGFAWLLGVVEVEGLERDWETAMAMPAFKVSDNTSSA